MPLDATKHSTLLTALAREAEAHCLARKVVVCRIAGQSCRGDGRLEDPDAWLDPLERGATLRVQGAIDRADRLPDGRLRIIDYKTGSARKYCRDPFDDGRRLQPVLYTLAAERLLGAEVAGMEYRFPTRRAEMEYRFPTRRAENAVRAYTRAELSEGVAIVDRLLDEVAAGELLPTADEKDCRYCDYAGICRVRVDGWGKVASPMAGWRAGRW